MLALRRSTPTIVALEKLPDLNELLCILRIDKRYININTRAGLIIVPVGAIVYEGRIFRAATRLKEVGEYFA
jgi:hypothetical protein